MAFGNATTGGARGSISVDTSQLPSARAQVQSFARGVSTDLTGMTPAVKQTEKSMQSLTGTMRSMVGVMGVGIGVVGIVRVFRGSIAAASDLTEAMGKVGVAFGDSGDKILEWSKNSATALGQSRHQALEAASGFGLLFATMDLAPAKSAEMSQALVELATDMASINNIPIDEALTKLSSGLVGQIVPLRSVGVLLNAATVDAKALEMGLAATTDAITDQDRVMARYQLILEQTRLTQGDFARTSGDLANQQRIATAAFKDAQAALGEMFQPAMVGLMQGLTAETNGLREMFQGLTRDIEAADAARRRFMNAPAATGDDNWFTRDYISEGIDWVNQQINMGPSQLTAVEIEAKALNKELATTTHMLANAEQGLVILQDQAARGLVDDAQVQRQIALVAELTAEVNRLTTSIANAGRIGSRGPNLASVSGTVARLRADGGFAKQAELEVAQVDYWHGIQAIDRKAHTAIQQATEQYGQARASTIAQFEKSIAREAEDFGRQRARAVAQHERQIADIRQAAAVREMTAISDRAERLVSMQEDFDRRRADVMEDYHARRAQAQADFDERRAMALSDFEESQAKNLENSQKRLADLDKRLHEEREKAQRAHRDTLLNAASRLDARAVAMEMRRFASEQMEREKAGREAVQAEKDSFEERQEQAQEAFDKQRERELAAFEKQRQQDEAAFAKRLAREDRDYALRLAQDQKAHDKRLADAKAADEQRIIDAQEAFDERIAQEDEDRGIRLSRQREDHADQLAEMARAQALRIQQIGEQQAEQRAKLNKEFEDQLDDLGLFNTARIAEQERFKDAATKLFNEMWGDWYKTMEDMHKAEREFAASMGPHPAPVDYFDPDTNVFGAASTSRSTSINIAPGAIVVNESVRPGDTAVEVEDALVRILERESR